MPTNVILTIIGVFAVLWLVLVILLFVVYRSYKSMDNSFAKIGYIAREDTKKYFEEAAFKAQDVYRQAILEDKKIIESVFQKVLNDSGAVIQNTLRKAEKESAEIILQAHRDSEGIKREARSEVDRYYRQAIDQAAEAIDWSLSQFVKETMSVRDHEDLIRKLIISYLHDHKQL